MTKFNRLSVRFGKVFVVILLFVGFMTPAAQTVAVKSGTSLPSAYQVNLSFSQEERTDPDALAFYLLPARDIQSDDPNIVATAQAITAGLTNDQDKALAIHDWVCENIYYDYDAYYGRTKHRDTSAVSVLNDRINVCAGYANLTAALMRASGIPAKRVSGYAISRGEQYPAGALDGTGETNHAWNEVCLDGRWIIIDATWDSPNRYEYGQFSSKGAAKHTYYDISIKDFSETHVTMEGAIYKEICLYADYDQYWTGNDWKSLNSGSATPVIKGGTMFVPVRGFVEAIGGTIEYTPPTKQHYARIICEKNWNYAQMWIGSDLLYVDTVYERFPAAPFIHNGSTMVPLRQVANALGCQVTWDAHADNWHGRVTIGYTV